MSTISSNMNLVLSTVGVDSGYDWENNLNASLSIIDSHNHTTGQGVAIPPAGLNISSDLTFQGNNATFLRSTRFSSQSAVLSGASDLTCTYVVGQELYYNDSVGNHVQITSNGNVAGTPGSIANLTSPASASYVSLSSTFVWQSGSNTPANMDGASYILRNLAASSKGLTLNPPLAMAADYSLTLPSLPASTRILSLDTSGAIATGVAGTVQTADLANASVTKPKLAALGQQISSGSGSFTTTSNSYVNVSNLSVTITTTGRPVMLFLQPDLGTVASFGASANVAGGLVFGQYKFVRDSIVDLCQATVQGSVTSGVGLNIGPFPFMLDIGAAAGSHTYTFQVVTVASSKMGVFQCVLVAVEM